MDDSNGIASNLDDACSHDEQKIPECKLSCDNCRKRKVRCDRTHPCGPCSRKQVHCTYPAGYKPRVKRRQVVVSQGYEQKLDEISRKIDLICHTVDKLGSSRANTIQHLGSSSEIAASATTATPVVSYTPPRLSETTDSDEGSSSELGGDVTLAAQAAFATNLAERLVDNAHPMDDLPEVKSSLTALKQSLSAPTKRHRKSHGAGLKPLSPSSSIEGFQLPPMQVAMTALQRLRESTRLRLFWCMEFDTIGQFVEYFMTVYSGQPSLAEMVIVHCGLRRLFVECANAESETTLKNDLQAQGDLCRKNLNVILSSMPFHLPTTFDYVLALFMMATYYLETCKLSLSWNCLAVASQMCQTLGYNRELLAAPESTQAKLRRTKLFWCIYMLDKSVALRLNRHSSLKDQDITLHVPDPGGMSADGPLAIIPTWVESSMLVGKIYDEIFSLGALSKPADERDSRARAIAADLQRIFAHTEVLEGLLVQRDRDALGDTVCDLMVRAERVSQLATLTLVYRGIRPPPNAGSAFCPECVQTADQCLEEHRLCLSVLKDVELSFLELYVQWALLSAPFVPFIVIFCHVIETRDQAHLGKLSAVVETLQLLPPSLPDIYRKQLRLFKLMYDVACKYINSPTSTPSAPTIQRTADMPLEMFFSEAGIPPPGRLYGQPDPAAQGDGQGDIEFNDYGVELGNWFDQNHHIFKMLEDTL